MDYAGFELYLQSKDLSKRTITAQVNFLKIIENECNSFCLEDCQKLVIEKLKNSRASANKYIGTIKNYCRFKELKWGEKLKRFSEISKPRSIFTDAEIYAFINLKMHFQTKYSIFWKILAYTGMRPGEALALKSEDITNVITIKRSKTGTGRTVPIPEPLKNDLYSYSKSKSERLFEFSDTSYRKEFKKRLDFLGIKKPVTPYSFRHSWATRNVQESPLFDVMSILGHKKAETTQIYYHGNLDTMKKVVKNDPLSKKCLTPEESLKKIIEEIEKVVDEDFLDVEIQKQSDEFTLHIVIREKK